MSLPASGQLSYGDIRTETQTTGRSSYSAAKAAWTTGSYSTLQYPPINMGSTSRPDISQPGTVSEWYSYNHSAFSTAPATVNNLGNRTKPQSPFGDFFIIDLGTTSGQVSYSIAISSSNANGASVNAEYGYPWDSSGNFVGGAGGTMFSTGLINSATSGVFTYTYNAGYGSKIYLSIDAIQSSAGWPTFNITVDEPAGFDVQLYSRAGDVPSSDEYNLFYSEDGTNWTNIAGPLSSTTCQTLSSVSISSGTIYIKAERDSNNSQIFIRGANSSTCPANLAVTCEYSAAITGNEDVAITVAVDGGDFVDC